MKYEEYQKKPIGTVFIFAIEDDDFQIEVKINEVHHLIIYEYPFEEEESQSDIGDEDSPDVCIENLEVAPDWLQEIFNPNFLLSHNYRKTKPSKFITKQ